MMVDKRAVGRFGEDLAASYLTQVGYMVLQRNYRRADGEIDIVAQDGGRLAFVEVRTRRSRSYGTAKESISTRKQQRLANVARMYLQECGLEDVEWGIDVVAVELGPKGALKSLELIRNAVAEEI